MENIKHPQIFPALVLTAALLAGCHALPAKTVTIADTQVSLSATQLDLSGRTLEDPQVITQLTALQELNLLDTGISAWQYDMLQQALPECSIRWSVPIAGGAYDNQSQRLSLQGLSAGELETLDRFPNLRELALSDCDDAVILHLKESRPKLTLSYQVTIGSMEIEPNQTSLIRTDASPELLAQKLPLLPKLTSIVFTEEISDPRGLGELMAQYPEIQFSGNPTIGGMETSLAAQTLDFSQAAITDVQELYDWIPCFRNLSQVELGDTTLENADLDRLNKHFRDVDIYWNLSLGPLRVSTSITFFMPFQYGRLDLPNSAYKNLRYCTNLRLIDMGHCELTNVDFVEFLPNLEYLLLCENRIPDAEALSKCTKLKYVEIFLTGVTDFYPLLNLSNVQDLNLAYDGCPHKMVFEIPEDLSPLLQMPYLDRLWMPLNKMKLKDQLAYREHNLLETMIIFPDSGSTPHGWRYSPGYYAQRDILGYYYMYK